MTKVLSINGKLISKVPIKIETRKGFNARDSRRHLKNSTSGVRACEACLKSEQRK